MEMDQKTLVKRGIKILDENKYFLTLTKKCYSKQVERLEVWKKMGKKEKGWSHCWPLTKMNQIMKHWQNS